jgi:hypothetical protein
MEYYLLPVEEGKEALQFEEALKRIDYDVDDRSSIWSKEDIDNIINTMTKENATKMILQFLPDPVGDKFAELLAIKL